MNKIKDIFVSINDYLNKHKIKVIVVTVVLFVLFSAYQIYKTYTYTQIVYYYESGDYNEDSADDVKEMFDKAVFFYGYRDTSVYVKLFADKIIEKYCDEGEYEKARFFASHNKHINKRILLAQVDTYEKENYENSTEGRTEMIIKNEKRNGLGGTDYCDNVIKCLFDDYDNNYSTVDYILPSWNRNDVYKTMVKNYIKENYSQCDEFCLDYYSLKESDYVIEIDDFNKYLHSLYNIDINATSVVVYDFNVDMKTYTIGDFFTGTSHYVQPGMAVLFKRDNKWFFGGFITKRGNNNSNKININYNHNIAPDDNTYNGVIGE